MRAFFYFKVSLNDGRIVYFKQLQLEAQITIAE
jgi:hypothetical protein